MPLLSINNNGLVILMKNIIKKNFEMIYISIDCLLSITEISSDSGHNRDQICNNLYKYECSRQFIRFSLAFFSRFKIKNSKIFLNYQKNKF